MDKGIKFNIGLFGIPPCKDCKSRAVGCHAGCTAYIDWKAEREKATAKWHRPEDREFLGYKKEALKGITDRGFKRKKEGRP